MFSRQYVIYTYLDDTTMDDALPRLRYWGKAKPETGSGPQWHPLIYHSLDVAACGRKLLEADEERHRGLARLSGLEAEALLAWLSFLLAIHALGRFSDGFQNQWSEHWRRPLYSTRDATK